MISPLVIVLSGVVLLVLMASTSIVILHIQGRRDRLKARVHAVAGPFQRRSGASNVVQSGGVGLADEAAGIGHFLARLLGFDPAMQDHYVMQWWLALLVTLVVATVVGRVAAGLVGNLSLLAILPVWLFLSRSFFNWCEARRRNKLFTQFPDALAMIVRSVRVGIPVTDSIRAVGRELEAPTGPEFARLSDELSIGVALDDGLKVMAERNGLQEYRFFATALSLQSQTGGGLSETLENLADVIRKRVAIRQKGEALSAEAKTSALVLELLPPLAAVGLFIMNPDYITVLFTDPTGTKLLASAVCALTGGILTMKYMIRKSLS